MVNRSLTPMETPIATKTNSVKHQQESYQISGMVLNSRILVAGDDGNNVWLVRILKCSAKDNEGHWTKGSEDQEIHCCEPGGFESLWCLSAHDEQVNLPISLSHDEWRLLEPDRAGAQGKQL